MTGRGEEEEEEGGWVGGGGGEEKKTGKKKRKAKREGKKKGKKKHKMNVSRDIPVRVRTLVGYGGGPDLSGVEVPIALGHRLDFDSIFGPKMFSLENIVLELPKCFVLQCFHLSTFATHY